MLHKRSNGKPHGVHKTEIIDEDSRFFSAWMGVVPLIRAKPEITKALEEQVKNIGLKFVSSPC